MLLIRKETWLNFGVVNMIINEKFKGNWKDYLKYAVGEILLVVFGILIALQINNWNEDRKERIHEIELINLLITDLNDRKAENISDRESGLSMINHFVSVLKHENTHIGQLQRSGGRRGESYDVRDKKKYFSDKGEIMAFAQNIVHDIMSKPGITTMSQALKEFTNHPLWKMEISKLDEVTKNRYKKYIYSYFELEFGKKNNPKK